MQPLASTSLPAPYSAAPRRVFLFSGHMVDTPDRPSPRFPAKHIHLAAQELTRTLSALRAGSHDVALAQAASGGDLLFLDACINLGVCCQVLLPFDEASFLQYSVVRSYPDGALWAERYNFIKNKLSFPLLDAPSHLGPLKHNEDAYERCNEWLLRMAKEHAGATAELHFICLWNGELTGSRGGTDHMLQLAKGAGAIVHWIDTRVWLASISAFQIGLVLLAVVAMACGKKD